MSIQGGVPLRLCVGNIVDSVQNVKFWIESTISMAPVDDAISIGVLEGGIYDIGLQCLKILFLSELNRDKLHVGD